MIIYHYFGSIGLCLLCGLLSSLLDKKHVKFTGFKINLGDIPIVLFFVYLVLGLWLYPTNPNNLFVVCFLGLGLSLDDWISEALGCFVGLLLLLLLVLLIF
tara:strand:- start:188 stop:490 length:303 start_codon:yes stop_codon:yes gene_type:complete